MMKRIPLLLVLILSTGSLSGQETTKKRSPIAPSLPYLTNEEEDKLDRIIDRFILFDTGRLPGPEGMQAQRDFDKLGYEAIPALIRGLNKAAVLEHSCPTLVISKKLSRLLLGSNDTELLEFARDTLGSSVGPTAHRRVIEDMRTSCMLRKNEITRRLGAMTIGQLTESARRSPEMQRSALVELASRRGPDALVALAAVYTTTDAEQKPFVRGLLERNLAQQTPAVIKEKLKDSSPEVRLVAIRVVANRHTALVGELIDLLADEVAEVRQAAHEALVKLNKGEDYGPSTVAEAAEIAQAQTKWQAWVMKRR
jgi:hypothetical protein